MADDLKSFLVRVDKFYDFALDDQAVAKIARIVGVAAKGDASQAFAADWGHGDKFHHWNAPATTAFNPVDGSPGQIKFGASGKGMGPWVVAQIGRHQGVGDEMTVKFRPVVAKYKKNGQLSKRQPRRRKWNGTTEGRDSWSDAEAAIGDKTPGRVNTEVEAAMRRAFGS